MRLASIALCVSLLAQASTAMDYEVGVRDDRCYSCFARSVGMGTYGYSIFYNDCNPAELPCEREYGLFTCLWTVATTVGCLLHGFTVDPSCSSTAMFFSQPTVIANTVACVLPITHCLCCGIYCCATATENDDFILQANEGRQNCCLGQCYPAPQEQTNEQSEQTSQKELSPLFHSE